MLSGVTNVVDMKLKKRYSSYTLQLNKRMETAITKIVIQSLKTRYLSKNKTLVQHHSPDRLQLYEIPFFKP